MKSRPRLVVIGNGMAGIRTVEALLKRAPDRYNITVFGAEPHANYNRILLSAVLAGERALDDIVINGRDWYDRNGITLHAGDPVIALDPATRTIASRSGRCVSYDILLIATGSKPLAPPVPGLDLAGVCAFRTIDDVGTMVEASGGNGRAVVIGGGLLGLEAAWGLKQRGMSVSVVHLMPTLMERQLDAAAGRLLEQDLARRGISFFMEGVTEQIVGKGRADAVRLQDGRSIPADLVVLAIGIRPEIGLAREAGLDVNRGIVVGDGLRTSDPCIYAVGECAEHRGKCFGLVAPLWEMAEICAERLAGDETACFSTPVLSTQLKITGVDVFSVGRLMPEDDGDEEITFQDTGEQTYRKLLLRDGKLVGAVLYGDITNAGWYLRLVREGTDVSGLRRDIVFGRDAVETASGSAAPDLGAVRNTLQSASIEATAWCTAAREALLPKAAHG